MHITNALEYSTQSICAVDAVDAGALEGWLEVGDMEGQGGGDQQPAVWPGQPKVQ